MLLAGFTGEPDLRRYLSATGTGSADSHTQSLAELHVGATMDGFNQRWLADGQRDQWQHARVAFHRHQYQQPATRHLQWLGLLQHFGRHADRASDIHDGATHRSVTGGGTDRAEL